MKRIQICLGHFCNSSLRISAELEACLASCNASCCKLETETSNVVPVCPEASSVALVLGCTETQNDGVHNACQEYLQCRYGLLWSPLCLCYAILQIERGCSGKLV